MLDANPSFAWVSYSDQTGAFTGVTRLDGGTLRIKRSAAQPPSDDWSGVTVATEK